MNESEERIVTKKIKVDRCTRVHVHVASHGTHFVTRWLAIQGDHNVRDSASAALRER